jgi:hypothetical protein
MSNTHLGIILLAWPASILLTALVILHMSSREQPVPQAWHIHLPPAAVSHSQARVTPSPHSRITPLRDQQRTTKPSLQPLRADRDHLSDALVSIAFRTLLQRTLAANAPASNAPDARPVLTALESLPKPDRAFLESPPTLGDFTNGALLDELQESLAAAGIPTNLAALLGHPELLDQLADNLDGLDLSRLGGGAFAGLGGLGGGLNQLQGLGQSLGMLGDLGQRLQDGSALELLEDRLERDQPDRLRRALLVALLLNASPEGAEDVSSWEAQRHTLY